MSNRRLSGTIACREYRVRLSSGRTATIAFALGDPSCDFWPAAITGSREPLAFGLLAVVDVPGEAEEAVFWILDHGGLSLVPDNGKPHPGEDVQEALPGCFARFLDEVGDVAPELAEGRRILRRSLGRSLH
ncbi:hypothetical protein [Enhydrobacter aerosaccus]|uniref:hypothetical protein n=1 Tax=Enhydrobacter aerosaccus TaxID=225324 RepID=UPI0011171399|nr:hypothetical protein [Enhydrobacter aerosaccus]